MTSIDLDLWQIDALAGLSDVSRSCEVTHVACFLRWATAELLLSADVGAALLARLVRPKLPRRLPRPVSEETISQAVLLAPEHLRPWFVLAGWAGLRAGEIAGLQRADIRETGEPPVIFLSGKGGHERVVPLAPFVLAELQAFGLPSRGAVFRRPSDDRPHTPARISELANAYLRSVGILDTFHQLRHRFGTQLYAATRDLRLVQELMGHASPSTTAGYVGWSSAAGVAGVALLPPASASI